jgi:hypothetical protein
MYISLLDQFVSALISYIPLSMFWINDNYADLTISGVFLTFYSIGLAFLRGTYFNLLVRGQTFRTNLGLFLFSLLIAACIVSALIIYLYLTFPELNFQQKLVSFSIAVAVVQEILRERQIAAGQQWRALLGDAIWLFTTCLILIFLFLERNLDLVSVFTSWGIGGLISIGFLLLTQNNDFQVALDFSPSRISRELTYLALIPFVGFSHTLLYTYIYSSEDLLKYLFMTKAILFCTIPLNFIINLQQFALMRDLHNSNQDGVNLYFRRQKLLVLLGVLSGLILFYIHLDVESVSVNYYLGFVTALVIGFLGVMSNPEILRKIVKGQFKQVFFLRLIWLIISFASFLVSTYFSSEISLLLALVVPDLILYIFLKARTKMRMP